MKGEKKQTNVSKNYLMIMKISKIYYRIRVIFTLKPNKTLNITVFTFDIVREKKRYYSRFLEANAIRKK